VTADVHYEAAFLRGALLVGLIHERDVHDWAESLLHDPEFETAMVEIVSTPVELSAMREALYPLAKAVEPRRLGMALLTAMHLEGAKRPADTRVRMLGQIRVECRLPPDIAAAIKKFENRQMFAAASVTTVTAPTADEVTAFLGNIARDTGPLVMHGRIPYLTG